MEKHLPSETLCATIEKMSGGISMFTFEMKKDRFTVLNLTDMQLDECH